MTNPLRRMPTAMTLTIGLALGYFLSGHRPAMVKAGGGGGGDRYGDYSLTTGPISIQYDPQTKTQTTQDALYFLDWKGGRLMATVPVQRQTAQGSQMIDGFVDRDLTADFRVESNPHFLMTPGSLGSYGDGCAPLFVFELTTKQVAVYKLKLQSIGSKSSSRFELMEIKSYATLPPMPTPAPLRWPVPQRKGSSSPRVAGVTVLRNPGGSAASRPEDRSYGGP